MAYPSFAAGDVLNASDMNAVGLWKITGLTATVTGSGATVSVNNGTATISGNATSITLASCFPTDFNAFKLVITDLDGSNGTSALVYQLDLNGTPATTNYSGAGIYLTFSSTTVNGINPTAWESGLSATNFGGSMEIFNPNVAVATYITSTTVDDSYYRSYGIKHTTATAYNGLKIAPNAGTMTGGKIAMYGFRL